MTYVLVVMLLTALMITTRVLYQTRKNSNKIKKIENKLKTYMGDLKVKKR